MERGALAFDSKSQVRDNRGRMHAAPVTAERKSAARFWTFVVRSLLVVAALMFLSSEAHAYAWMVRHGYAKCNACHTDPSGGETLTHMGRVQSQLLLSQAWGEAPELDDKAKLLLGLGEPDSVRIGGSFRWMNLYSLATDETESEFATFPMQIDAYGWTDLGAVQLGGSLGLGDVEVGDQHMRAAQLTSGEGYVPLSRNHWIGIELGENGLLRAGRLNLPFGVRIPEHVAWVRDATKTDRESDQQHGIAFSYWGGHWRSEGMLVLGNYQVAPDDFRERGYAGYVEYLFGSDLAIGLTSEILQSRSGPHFAPSGSKVLRHAHGAMARFAATENLAVLAELDFLKTSGSGIGFVGFLQGNYEIFQGLHGIVTLEALDQGKSDAAGAVAAKGAGEALIGVWGGLNWFFLPHFDVRLEAVYRQESATSIQSQLHFFF